MNELPQLTPKQNWVPDGLFFWSSLMLTVSVVAVGGLVTQYFSDQLPRDWYWHIPLSIFAAVCSGAVALADYKDSNRRSSSTQERDINV